MCTIAIRIIVLLSNNDLGMTYEYPKMDEWTTADHEEMKISPEIEIKLACKAVWYYGVFTTEESQKQACKDFGITWEQALEWKDYWLERQREYVPPVLFRR